ncbi:hypothetical protein SAMN05660657_04119 [Geodermatophilus amargosae]|uniref:Uncharacterized protein n=1 Tax=Geodermatophilus amargosae TaxID=1296565 RepID=A0A1I7C607_9ACTN|nr:hypothetical protein [Geodermatophilus amargosae]SFT94856.1 hypothetical protein SAMN05660657_04119 [Geodermatophilus amargosae]
MAVTASPPSTPVDRAPVLRRALWVAAVWSALHLAVATWWLLDPAARPGLEGGDENGGSGLLTVLPPTTTAWMVLALAAGGLAATGAAALRRPSTGTAVAAFAVAGGLGVLTADLRALVLLGYLCAIVAPAAFLVVFTVGALRSRRARPWLAAVGLAVGAGLASGVLEPSTIGRLAEQLHGSLAAELPPRGHLALLLAGAVLFAVLGVLVRRAAVGACDACGRPGPAWTRPEAAARWGRVATLVAAAGPLPYGLLRMTWLTPWPVGLPDASDPALRLFGLSLGVAALGGAVLTIGLIRPWGEVWPSWIPVLRGRPVPVRVPVLAGGLVAVVLLAASPGMIAIGIAGLRSGDLFEASFLLVFPTLPWGLALAAAVTGYALRRRGACTTCGQGQPPLAVRS